MGDKLRWGERPKEMKLVTYGRPLPLLPSYRTVTFRVFPIQAILFCNAS